MMPPVMSDPNQLESALLNLVVNARDAMPHGGRISIEARRRVVGSGQVEELPAGDYMVLSVTDEGAGMDNETLEKATTPFFTTKGIGKGTGLGLPMIQGLMAQSGGALVLKSRQGEGTRAELWLPIADPDEKQNPASDVVADVPPLVERSLTVLAVDDDALVRMNTALMLEDLGHVAIEAQSGKEALRMLDEGGLTDIVITDQAMPEMTGVELIKQLALRYPHIPVILATGYAELPNGVGAGLQRLAKPFMQEQLNEALALCLGLSKP